MADSSLLGDDQALAVRFGRPGFQGRLMIAHAG